MAMEYNVETTEEERARFMEATRKCFAEKLLRAVMDLDMEKPDAENSFRLSMYTDSMCIMMTNTISNVLRDGDQMFKDIITDRMAKNEATATAYMYFKTEEVNLVREMKGADDGK